jgi:cysteine synthase A
LNEDEKCDEMNENVIISGTALHNAGLIPDIGSLIGNTPLLKIDYLYKNKPGTIYAKAENFNLTGSIKDRMAFHIINKAYKAGKLKKGDRIVEVTSGNTGISFSAIGRAFGHPVTIFMPDWLSKERINLIKSFGADINLISKKEGGFLKSIELAEDLAAKNNDTFLPRQFSNSDNSEAHYESTGPEIWLQLKHKDLKPDAFIAGVGTGGTIMGAGRFLKEVNPEIKLFPLEPENSPTLSTGYKVGAHRIQGISDEFIPALVDLNFLDEVVAVDDGDSIIMAQKLASILGLGVGISSGANFLGAVKIHEQLGPDSVVVTILADDNKKYLSTDLLEEIPSDAGFINSNVRLLSFKSFGRVCRMCCDPII